MKKHLFKFFMLALSLLLSIPIARAADISPTEQVTPDASSETKATRLDGSIIWWFNSNNKNITGSHSMTHLNGKLYVANGGGNETFTLKIANATTFGGVTSTDINLANVGSNKGYAALHMASLCTVGDQVFGCSYGGANLNLYNLTNPSAPTYVGKIALGMKGGEIIGAWGDMNNGRIAFANVENNKIGYIEITSGNVNLTPKFITLNKSVGEIFTNASEVNSRIQVKFLDDKSFFISYHGGTPRYFSATGEYLGQFPQGEMPSQNFGCTSEFITYKGQKFAAIVAGTGKDANANIYVYDWTEGINNAKLIAKCVPTYKALDGINDTGHYVTQLCSKLNNNELSLWIMQPTRGAALFKVTLPEPPKRDPVAASNLKVNQTWNGGKQTAVLSWTPGENLTSYKILKGTSAADAQTEVATITNTQQSSYTIDAATLGTGSATVYCLTSYNGNQKVGINSYFTQQDLGFGKVDLQGTLTGTTAKLTWTGPQYGEVDHYEVWQNVITNDNGKVTEEDNWVDKNIAAGTKEYTKDSYVAQKVENGKSILTSFYVTAVMKQTITVSKDQTSNTVKSNVLSLKETGNPIIYNAIVYDGRNTATIEWEYPGSQDTHVYYDIYRNGVLIKKDYEAAKFSDMNLPNGTYTYYVVGHKADDLSSRTSNTATCTIKRNRLVTGYGLEVVYNYPIMSESEAGGRTDVVLAQGVFANAKDKVGAYGAPGDAYRQAQFYNGYWYLACLTTKCALGTYIPNAWTDAECKKQWGDVKAGILKIGARGTEGIEDPRKLKDHTWDELKVNDSWPLENQSVAISEDGRIYRRGLGNHPADLSNNGPLHAQAPACDLFYLPWQYVCQPSANGLAGRSDINITAHKFDQEWVSTGDLQQKYRTHYISAGGNSANGTDYLLFAMNKTRDVWRVLPDGSATKFIAPKPADATKDDCTSTENYAFPVVGRGGDFIHQVRGEGLYYVNAATGEYTTVYSKDTDVSNSGGVTFKYNDEIFLLHPISTRSNNVGHFAIDMAKKYGEDPDQASFTEMIPVASFMQEGMANFVAGNSNANWFGAEESKEDDCIYIYQYVPGVRFAKYKLYKYLDFPGVKPELDIQVVESPKANGSGDEVELLTAVATWQRPNETSVEAGGDGYRPDLANTEYLIGEYEVEFLDNNNAPYSGNDWNKKLYADVPGGKYNGGDAKDKDFNTSIYHGYYGKDENGITTQKNLKEVSHTVRVTPIYHKKSNWDVTVRGEGNIAIARADYPAGIKPLEVHAYDGTKNGLGYRVDFNFDRASMEEGQYPHHVSFFTIEVSKDGGTTFDKLTNYYFIWGNGYHSPSNENFEYVYDSYGRDFNDVVRKDGDKSYIVDLIPGDYRFGNGLGEEKLRDRYYYQKPNGTKNANALNKTFTAPDGTELNECYKGLAAPDANGVCVAYYYTNENPKDNLYRAVAHYAAGNETIHKEAYTTAVAPLDMTTTGVDNIAGDNEGNLSIYPVPAESTVTVNAPVGISNVKVFSLSGSLVLDVKGEGNNTQTIDVSMLTPGVYMVAVNSLTPVRMIKR